VPRSLEQGFQKRILLICLCALPLLIMGLLTFVIAATTRPAEEANEACIRCHVTPFNAGLQQEQIHPPFFERQCTACHLAEGSDWNVTGISQTEVTITGTLVNQEIIWGKVTRVAGEGSATEHLIALTGLETDNSYRFRLVNGVEPDRSDVTSSWYGLRLADLTGTSSILVVEDLSGTGITALTIARTGSTGAIISWQTSEPLYGEVELQLLEGDLGTTETAAVEDTGHPPLRDPEDLAINACYQCHPESSLGTSHPVRLYGGQDVRIPEELPTVDGMLTCVTCHDPHGAPGQMLVRETIKTKLCVACHYKFKNSSPSTMFR